MISQPYSILPDLQDTTLEGAWFNTASVGTSDDVSDNLNHGSSTSINHLKVGAEFTAGNFVISSTTFTTQAYSIAESGVWNRYVDNGTTIYKNGSSTGSKPLDITATGFTGETVELMDVEVYSEAKGAAWISQDTLKRVPDPNLVLLISDGGEDYSRYRRTLTFSGASIGSQIILAAGGITWTAITGFTSYAFWWKSSATAAWTHYATDGTTDYENGVAGGTLPFTIADTGFSGETGTIAGLQCWDAVKGAAEFRSIVERGV